jgi:hypothetical protein
MSDAEEAFAFQLRAVGIVFYREIQFAPPRKWRADFVFHSPSSTDRHMGCLLLEVDGGTWAGGRHTTGAGFAADCAKLNEATLLGYRVLRVTPAMVEDGSALALVERALHGGAK